MGPGGRDAPVPFRVTLDGELPGAAHGSDVDADGTGILTYSRMYQVMPRVMPNVVANDASMLNSAFSRVRETA